MASVSYGAAQALLQELSYDYEGWQFAKNVIRDFTKAHWAMNQLIVGKRDRVLKNFNGADWGPLVSAIRTDRSEIVESWLAAFQARNGLPRTPFQSLLQFLITEEGQDWIPTIQGEPDEVTPDTSIPEPLIKQFANDEEGLRLLKEIVGLTNADGAMQRLAEAQESGYLAAISSFKSKPYAEDLELDRVAARDLFEDVLDYWSETHQKDNDGRFDLSFDDMMDFAHTANGQIAMNQAIVTAEMTTGLT